MSLARRAACVAGVLGATGLWACDQGAVEVPVAFSVSALTGSACGDPNNPTPGVDPAQDIGALTMTVREPDPATGGYKTLVSETQTIANGSISVVKVPEGTDREVTLHADGASQMWWARTAGVSVQRDTTNEIPALLTRYGGASCAPTPADTVNATFSAAATLGDGRVMVTGGFMEVVSDASGNRLSGASDQAFIFNPHTGEMRSLGSMGGGRGAHAMVYLEDVDKVLILGGANEIPVDETLSFPLVADLAQARSDYVLFDVATETFAPGVDSLQLPRVFPRVHYLPSDGTVLVTGGGTWPGGTTEYADVEIFWSGQNGGAGGFLPVSNLRSCQYRAGHSLTYLRSSVEGLSQLLVWGGAQGDSSGLCDGGFAEVFKQSGRQIDGVNGSFEAVLPLVFEGAPNPVHTYFHETVALRPITERDEEAGTTVEYPRFLVVGGARFDEAASAIMGPQADEAWMLEYHNDFPGFGAAIIVSKVPGLGSGRVFHGLTAPDGLNATVMGGMIGVEAITTDKVKYFDVTQLASPWSQDAAVEAAFAPRGGHISHLAQSWSTMLVGGEASLRPSTSGSQRATFEVFTPSNLPRP